MLTFLPESCVMQPVAGYGTTADQPQQPSQEGSGASPSLIESGGYADSDYCPKKLLRSGISQALGPRANQEDRATAREQLIHFGSSGKSPVEFYSVYDGHGGTAAVEFVEENLPATLLSHPGFADFHSMDPAKVEEALRKSFEQTEAELLRHLRQLGQPHREARLPRTRSVVAQTGLSSGSCACVALLSGKTLYLANLGDCRALLCTHTAIRELTTDHRPTVHDGEKERLEKLGVEVTSDGYINSQLGVSRAFGDLSWESDSKCDFLMASPEVSRHELEVGTEFLLLACDGIFEKMTPKDAVQTVRRNLRTTKDPVQAAQKLVAYADKLNSPDNLTALVVLFQVPPPTDRRGPNLFERKALPEGP